MEFSNIKICNSLKIFLVDKLKNSNRFLSIVFDMWEFITFHLSAMWEDWPNHIISNFFDITLVINIAFKSKLSSHIIIILYLLSMEYFSRYALMIWVGNLHHFSVPSHQFFIFFLIIWLIWIILVIEIVSVVIFGVFIITSPFIIYIFIDIYFIHCEKHISFYIS